MDAGGRFPTGKLKDGTTKAERARVFLCEHVGADPDSLRLWGRVVAGYCAQWSATSYTVMVNDYFDKGRIPGEKAVSNNGNGTHFGIASPANRGTHNRPATKLVPYDGPADPSAR
ncbi:MAG: hypothetical protein WC700_19985 [Gemmatimonadaceae bacterium]